MSGVHAMIYDAFAKKYDVWAEGSYAKIRAAKARGAEETDKWTKDLNCKRVVADEGLLAVGKNLLFYAQRLAEIK